MQVPGGEGAPSQSAQPSPVDLLLAAAVMKDNHQKAIRGQQVAENLPNFKTGKNVEKDNDPDQTSPLTIGGENVVNKIFEDKNKTRRYYLYGGEPTSLRKGRGQKGWDY